jgi:hypothetical protein
MECIMAEYDRSKTWGAKSLWTGTGDKRKPHPDAVAAFEYIKAHKIVKGWYKSNAHPQHGTTFSGAMRRHLPNAGIGGQGTKQALATWRQAVAAVKADAAPADAPATDAVTITGDQAKAFAEWQASQA